MDITAVVFQIMRFRPMVEREAYPFFIHLPVDKRQQDRTRSGFVGLIDGNEHGFW